jgi:putative tricarboxylic transport membrane protein
MMFDGLFMLGAAVGSFATFESLITIIWATLLGLVIGILPGLTATMGVALMVTTTYGMEPSQAILVLMCVYLGAIYGGSRTAILLNIPGTPANAAATLDGFPLALQGKAGLAMGLSTMGSTLGTMVGVIALALIAPPLGEFSMRFGSYEFFWLALFGVIISGRLGGGDDPLKGYLAGVTGLLIATIGLDSLHAVQRFTFGVSQLTGGINLIPAMVGAFGLAEILNTIKSRVTTRALPVSGRVIPKFSEVARYWKTILRSGLIGTSIGIIPGAGEDIGSWASYAAAKRSAKHPEEFGKGSHEGLLAAETGDNAVVSASMIPTLTLALPSSAASAVILAAMYIHGVRPGPMLMVENPTFLYQVIAMLMLATIANLIFGLSFTKSFIKIVSVPRARLMAVVAVLCVVGSFATSQSMFDVYVMLAFGIVGYILRQLSFPMAPLVLGIVLGDLLDLNLRRGLGITNGDWTPFFTRPISLILMTLIIIALAMSIPPVARAVRSVPTALGLGRKNAAPTGNE